MYVFMTVSGWFSDCFLIWASVNMLFAWKPIANSQKEKINNLKAKASDLFSMAKIKVDQLIPKYKDETKQD